MTRAHAPLLLVLVAASAKPDGSSVLTDNSPFDPAVALEENWVRMEKPPR
jgi:hypothetical protein